MRKIKDILSLEISKGAINWEKLQQRIFAALELTHGNFKSMNVSGEEVKLKLDDAVTFKCENRCIKLFTTRFINGELWCNGYQTGFYGEGGKPVMIPETKVLFDG